MPSTTEINKRRHPLRVRTSDVVGCFFFFLSFLFPRILPLIAPVTVREHGQPRRLPESGGRHVGSRGRRRSKVIRHGIPSSGVGSAEGRSFLLKVQGGTRTVRRTLCGVGRVTVLAERRQHVRPGGVDLHADVFLGPVFLEETQKGHGLTAMLCAGT